VPATPRTRSVAPLALVALVWGAGACGSDAPTVEGPGANPSLVRPDIACDDESLGGDDTIAFTTAYVVVDGQLGATCLGGPDGRLVAAWDELVAISPPGQLTDLDLFAGFTSREDGDSETLAYVNALDSEGTAFQMSVNLPAFGDDRAGASLTLAHEFSHVFTETPSQLDRSVTDPADCTTHFNGDGCYRPDSLMAAWIGRFWSTAELADVDVDADPYPEDGDARCDADDSFLGPYAATNPEEDFAESFSAFVYQVEPETPGQEAKQAWIADRPGLAEFRDRAATAGLGPLPNAFELCGS
jgi:hypothetical protein